MKKTKLLALSLFFISSLCPLHSTVSTGINKWKSIGPYGGSVRLIVIDPVTPTTLYSKANRIGLFKSLDGGASWTPSNNGLANINVNTLTIDPHTPTTLYAGIYYGGVFKSMDGGHSWGSANGGITGNNVLALVIDPMTTSTIYAGTNDGGVFKSTNGGSSWSPANIGLIDTRVISLAVDPVTPTTLYVGTEGGYVFKSVDGSNSWSLANIGLTEGTQILSLAIDPGTPTNLYALSNRVFRSTDGGNSWIAGNAVTSPQYYPNAFAMDPVNPANLYVGTYGGGIFKSTDCGNTWTVANTGLQDVKVLSLTVDPHNPATLYAGTVYRGVSKSTDGGGSWSRANVGLTETLVTSVAIDSLIPATLYAATDRAGVFKSADGGLSWSEVDTGLTSSYVSVLAVDPVNPTTLYAGAYSGVFKTTDGGNSWNEAVSGLSNTDVRALIIDPVTPTTLYAGTVGGLFKSADGGISWTPGNNGLANKGISALAIDPANPSTLYAGTYSGVFKSTDGGNYWKSVNDGLMSTEINALVIDSNTTTTLFAGTGSGVFKSTDGGISWNPENNGLTNTGISALAIDPANPATVYAGTYGGVFKSTDGGNFWRSANAGLTTLEVNALTIAPSSPPTLYAGTNGGGVFRMLYYTVSLTPNINSPQPTRSRITFTATPSNGTQLCEYQFWQQNPAGNWSIVQAYSQNSSFEWDTTGIPLGTYLVDVWVRNVGSSEECEEFQYIPFTIVYITASLSSDKLSPQLPGAKITFTATASGGTGAFEYQFWIQNPSGDWNIIQDFSPNSSYYWDTTNLPSGIYLIDVLIRSAGSNAPYETFQFTTFTITRGASSVSFTSTPPSPQRAGTAITFQANAAGVSDTYEYQFWLQHPSGSWILLQAYSLNSLYCWNTASLAPGAYLIVVWARGSGSVAQCEAFNFQIFHINPTPASSVTLTPILISPQPIGTPITLNANASGGSGIYEYQFWLRDTEGTWNISQAYSQNSEYILSTLLQGTYTIDVWARSLGSIDQFETYSAIDFTFNLLRLSLLATPSSPRPPGTMITFTANASGGTGAYEYQFWLHHPIAGWSIVREYSTTSSYEWDTSGLPAATYQMDVWARVAGSTVQYQGFRAIDFVLK